jgi:phosphoglycolate phosphatase
MNHGYQLIIFDWDGTLMDSTAHIVHCMRQAINDLEFEPLDDNVIRHIIGLGLDEAVHALYPTLSLSQRQPLTDQYLAVWRQTPHDPTLFDHAVPLLEKLAKQDIFLAVATGKSRRGLDRMLALTGLGDLFHATRCADECHSKPHPQMVDELVAHLGVTPPQSLVIGDTQYDLNMAHNAGADSLGVTSGAHSHDLLQACQPRAIVSDLKQVELWLETSNKG